MMYEEFKDIWTRVALNRPMPSIEAYHETIEPFYMAAGMEKDEFVKLYTKMPVIVARVATELYKKDGAIFAAKKAAEDAKRETVRKEAASNETLDAMAKYTTLLVNKMADLDKEVVRLNGALEALRARFCEVVRGLCDKCLEKVLFN